MAFELQQRKHIDRELRKIVRQQLGKAIRVPDPSDGAAKRKAVQESRRRVKRVRAAIAFLEHSGATIPRKDRKRLKAAAQALSRLRDSAAIIDTFDRVRRHYRTRLPAHTYERLRQALVEARDRQEAQAQRDDVLGDVVRQLEATRRSAKAWTLPSIALEDAMIGVVTAYRRSRKTMHRASATGRSATVHRWRKDLKTFWYQLRLVAPLATGAASLVADVKRLQTQLGDDHNLVVLAATLRSCSDLRSMRGEIRQMDRLAARLRQALRRHAFARGRRLHARKPKAFAEWLHESSTRRRSHHSHCDSRTQPRRLPQRLSSNSTSSHPSL